MAYTVLARKYRSRTFDEVIGQEPIATTLKNAIATGRVHHAYLFCGTRGVGKTSMARILAKALNCLAHPAPTTEPCNQCDSCVAIAAGEDVDVIEIDAASNTGVDNIRELRSNAIYRPARSRFKVYIIDEVHMLSTGAFNALLKTLEEPPEHVKFIMATTEPQKVPATIQSRCQRFDFRPIPAPLIAGQLERICKQEKVSAEPVVLRRIARLANGSMRDALSLLDQLLSLGAKKLTQQLLGEVLPSPGDEQIAALVDRIVAQDAAEAIRALDATLAAGHSLEAVVVGLIEHIRGLMLMRVCGPDTDLVDAAESLRSKMAEQARAFDEPTYVFLLALLEDLRRAVRYSGTGRALVEAALVRMCLLGEFVDLSKATRRLQGPDSVRVQRAPAASAGAVSSASASRRGAKKGVSPSGPVMAGAGANLRESRPAVNGPVGRYPVRSDSAAEVPGTAQRSAGSGTAAAGTVGPVYPQGRRTNGLTSAELSRIVAIPAVRTALELFEGTLVNVRQAPAATVGPSADAAENGHDAGESEQDLEEDSD